MFDAEIIKSEMLGLVGWKQNPDPAGRQIGSELLKSDSGIFFQQQHALIKHDNLISSAPEFDRRVYPPYDNSKAYVIGDIVIESTKLYRAIAAGTGNPVTNTTYWEEFLPYHDWLKDLTETGILKAINDWVAIKIGNGSAKSIISYDRLYKGTKSYSSVVENDNNFVFHELKVSRSNNIRIKIPKIAFEFDATGTFNVLLFHSESDTPIRQMAITYAQARTKQWFDLVDTTTVAGESLPFILSGSGSYYIGYNQFQSGQARAISGDNLQYSDVRLPVNCKEIGNLEIKTGKVAGPINNLWDIDTHTDGGSETFGMDLALSAYCDYTDFLVENRMIFRELIAKATAIVLIEQMAFNPYVKDNKHTKNIDKTYAEYVLSGDAKSPRPSGLKHEYKQALEAVMFDKNSIDSVCLPCRDSGISYSSIP